MSDKEVSVLGGFTRLSDMLKQQIDITRELLAQKDERIQRLEQELSRLEAAAPGKGDVPSVQRRGCRVTIHCAICEKEHALPDLPGEVCGWCRQVV